MPDVMKLPFLRPRMLTEGLRELARRRPAAAEEYIDAHQEQWEELVEADPHNAADILEALDSRSAADLLSDLDIEDIGDVLDEMRPESAADIIEELTPDMAADLVESMDTDQAADLIGALEDSARDEVLAAIEPDAALRIGRLLAYPADTAGGMMTTDVATLPMGISAGEAIEALRRFHEDLGSNLSYVFVVDDEARLRGVVSFRDLVFSRPGVALDEVMVHDPYYVTPDADREIVAEIIQRYHLLAIPVVDANGGLLGIVRIDEAMEAAREESSADIATMVGAGAEESTFTPIPRSVRMRLPWIIVNLATAFIAVAIISRFEATIAQTAVLAAFMPLVASMGGNTGAQSLAVVIRGMALGEIPRGRARAALRREITLGVLNGLVLGVLAGLVGSLWADSSKIGVIVAISVALNLMVAGTAGAGIPIVLRRLGLDPALASNIFLTTITDAVGFGGFLATAKLLL